MVKFAVFAKSLEKNKRIKELLLKHHIVIDEDNPDFVISSGGDGLFLISERVYPGVPKVILRDSKIGVNCVNLTSEEAIKRVIEGKYKIEEIPKLKAIRRGMYEIRNLIGVNDIVIRNSLPTEAIRFKCKINNKKQSDELIGDGVVIATPFGSNKGAYFYSITRECLNEHFGLAFNNTNNIHRYLKLQFDDKIEITITRGIGVLVADNNRDYIPLEKGDKIDVALSDSKARIVRFY